MAFLQCWEPAGRGTHSHRTHAQLPPHTCPQQSTIPGGTPGEIRCENTQKAELGADTVIAF